MSKRNILVIFLIFGLCLLYSGCNKKNDKDEPNLNKNDLINIADTISFASDVTSDLTLPATYGDVSATWVSSNKNALQEDGKINRSYQDISVDLSVTLSYGSISYSKTFTINIVADPVLKESFDLINSVYENLTIASETIEDVNLPTEINNVNISWLSDNESIISNEGTVNLPDNDTLVTLIATLTYLDFQLDKEFEVLVLKNNEEIIAKSKVEEVAETFPELILDNLEFTTTFANGVTAVYQSSDEEALDNSGVITIFTYSANITLTVTYSYNGYDFPYVHQMTIGSTADYNRRFIENAITEITLPASTKENITLPTTIEGISITWKSSTIYIISDTGEVFRKAKNQTGIITGTFSYQGESMQKQFSIVVEAYSDEEMVAIAIELVELPSVVSDDFYLPTSLDFSVSAVWMSNNQDVISNDGKVVLQAEEKTVTLTIYASKGEASMNKEFTVKTTRLEPYTLEKPHQVIVRASNFESSKFENVELHENKLRLIASATSGSYESSEISTIDFTALVASWACVSSDVATAELFVKVKVNGVWSNYITYHKWGFGLANACYDQTNSLIRLTEDEVKVLNSQKGNAVMFKVVLERTSLSVDSSALSLVSFALQSSTHTYKVSTTNLPASVMHDVPRLNQNVVPTIGGVICSATSSTMLLKFHGFNFSEYDTYEHRYIAGKVRENNTGIYGNWVYNTVCIGSFGLDAYVARMYSVDELIAHLANIGPVALSVKGTMTSNQASYTTGGHLIVAIGYKYINGVLYILCNDPNVSTVYCEYSVGVIKNTWRNIAYVIE